MAVDNSFNTLVVYGSYAPGAENHGVFAGLPGQWEKGKIRFKLTDPPDGLRPCDDDEVDAWLIEFSDLEVNQFSREYKTQKRLLNERWTALDQAMGDGWIRDLTSWWPEDCEPVDGADEMIAAHIYLPVKDFPHGLDDEDEEEPPGMDRGDVPSPDDEDEYDPDGMWHEVKAGTKQHDPAYLMGLIKDATPDQYAELFGDLPGGDEFIRKLQRFYQEHRKGSGNLLWDGESGSFSLNVSPLEKHTLAQDDLIDLVKADVKNRAALLRAAGFDDEAGSLETLTFAFGKRPSAESADESASDALDHAADLIGESRLVDDHWMRVLTEACYAIAANYDLARWLMSHWYAVDFDFEPSYGIWKAGGVYAVAGDTCHVYRDTES